MCKGHNLTSNDPAAFKMTFHSQAVAVNKLYNQKGFSCTLEMCCTGTETGESVASAQTAE